MQILLRILTILNEVVDNIYNYVATYIWNAVLVQWIPCRYTGNFIEYLTAWN